MTSFMYIFCLLSWGLSFVAIKFQGHAVAPEVSLSYRLAISAILFVAITAIVKPSGRPRRQDLPFVVGFGLLNFAFSYLFLYHSTKWIPAALVTVIFSLKTITTPLALRLFLRQPLHPMVLLGGLIGVAGVTILVFPLLQTAAAGDILQGVVFAATGTLLASLGDACSARNSQRKVHPLYANSVGFIAAAAALGVLGQARGLDFLPALSLQYVLALLYLTLFASCLAWIFYLNLVERIGASASSYMVALFPAVGGLASVAIGESPVSAHLLAGCLLSCLGAAVALGWRHLLRWLRPPAPAALKGAD